MNRAALILTASIALAGCTNDKRMMRCINVLTGEVAVARYSDPMKDARGFQIDPTEPGWQCRIEARK